jgi:hypothetical protein
MYVYVTMIFKNMVVFIGLFSSVPVTVYKYVQ